MRHDGRSPLAALVRAFLPRLRYPYLVLALGGLLLVDLVVPDPIPLVDELMLAILTFIAASFTTRRDDRQPPRDVTPANEAGDDPGPPSALPR
jgi:hypothetical protein